MSAETRYRVLVVDDSALVRRLIVAALAQEPAIEVVGSAADGRAALECVERLAPDLVTLDVEMPELDGLATLRELRLRRPLLPVVMFSSPGEQGARTTVAALLAGANDFVSKPSARRGVDDAVGEIGARLVPKILALCAAARGAHPSLALTPTSCAVAPAPVGVARTAHGPKVVAIGVSTGGPAALSDLLSFLAPGLPVPIVIVQHMPAGFTCHLAESLSRKSGIAVREAVQGQVLAAGDCLIAPGDQHLRLVAASAGARVLLEQSEPENSCRPSVDVLFRSVAALYGARSLALVMTGMGHDGLAGARELHSRGAAILAQDEASSVVWGMPGYVVRAGLAERVLDVAGLAAELRRRTATPPVARAG